MLGFLVGDGDEFSGRGLRPRRTGDAVIPSIRPPFHQGVGACTARLMDELRAERDIARARLERAVFQRDACIMVISGMLLGVVIWRWA